jgi:hypothetical protein
VVCPLPLSVQLLVPPRICSSHPPALPFRAQTRLHARARLTGIVRDLVNVGRLHLDSNADEGLAQRILGRGGQHLGLDLCVIRRPARDETGSAMRRWVRCDTALGDVQSMRMQDGSTVAGAMCQRRCCARTTHPASMLRPYPSSPCHPPYIPPPFLLHTRTHQLMKQILFLLPSSPFVNSKSYTPHTQSSLGSFSRKAS